MGLIQVERSLALLWLKIIASDNEIFVIGNSERKKKKAFGAVTYGQRGDGNEFIIPFSRIGTGGQA